MNPLEVLSIIAGIIVLVIGVIAATFLAMAKWGFVSQERCDAFRVECHSNCNKDRASSRDVISYKLDGICSEIAQIKVLINKDQERFLTLSNFLGKVEEFMNAVKKKGGCE